MWRDAWTVCGKEWLDSVRDRRSVAAAALYVLFGPLVAGLALGAMARSTDPDRPIVVAIEHRERAPALVQHLEAARHVQVVAAASGAEAAVRARVAPIGLRIADDYDARFTAARPAEIAMVYDASRAGTPAAVQRLRTLVEGYAARVADARLVTRGVLPAVTRPLDLQERDLATAASRASTALATLPLFLMMSAFVASMGVAIDVTAGERERGSLEPLLLHPVSRQAIAVGKWMAAALFSAWGLLIALVAIQLVLRSDRVQRLDLPIGLTRADLPPLLGLLLPLALFAPAAQMLAAIGARTFREAQTWLSLLLFVPMVPGFLFAFGALAASDWMRRVPILGHHLLVSDLLRGERPDVAAAIALGVVTTAVALACVTLAGLSLRRERVLYGR